MKITQLRNATVIIEANNRVILLDPMLAPKGSIPALKYLTRRRQRNPLVELPENANALLERVTHCLITHCQKGHFDHLDRAAVKWLREHQVPTICMQDDADYLVRKGLKVSVLEPRDDEQAFLGGTILPIPCVHGYGLVGNLMAHGHGFFIRLPGEPSLYIAGDTVLTEEVKKCLTHRQPDVSVLPAGGARFDLGDEIIMGGDEVIAASHLSSGIVVANHLEALDHCPVSRKNLARLCQRENLQGKLLIPADGQTLTFAVN
ncbi:MULTISPECIES: MBL fold metallo-hydrolase [unclassified Marinobacter]|uniref:MBL fold metallo-hydrolase n=1 Tax=unclassified Marinobacter TaxID=83889 RepID=UPI0019273D60|nr:MULTISPECIES: MBL fold metallo-hydrolase [unclassified Marinobacter]MBL3824287.1 MBL fold metallo-hydrolase [Marinobacter sp. MC3]MBL3892621.1 MBL fold metallo-hydrolase [Marinobacter sp. MW3]